MRVSCHSYASFTRHSIVSNKHLMLDIMILSFGLLILTLIIIYLPKKCYLLTNIAVNHWCLLLVLVAVGLLLHNQAMSIMLYLNVSWYQIHYKFSSANPQVCWHLQFFMHCTIMIDGGRDDWISTSAYIISFWQESHFLQLQDAIFVGRSSTETKYWSGATSLMNLEFFVPN